MDKEKLLSELEPHGIYSMLFFLVQSIYSMLRKKERKQKVYKTIDKTDSDYPCNYAVKRRRIIFNKKILKVKRISPKILKIKCSPIYNKRLNSALLGLKVIYRKDWTELFVIIIGKPSLPIAWLGIYII